MITVSLILAALVLGVLLYLQIAGNKNTKSESVDLVETLLPEINIHEEVAKTAEIIKAREPITKQQAEKIVAEAKAIAKPKRRSAKLKKPTKK